ncbi:MAG: PQQ-dependent sugar dehydrogenase [Ferruginibacter sp.]
MKLLLRAVSVVFLFACNSNSKKTSIVGSTPFNTQTEKYNLDKIKIPEGFHISVYAEIPNARSMTVSPSGVLYVGNRSEDKVYAITDMNRDGKADKVYIVASGLSSPNGVAFKNGDLYIATISSILKLTNIESNLAAPPAPVTVYNQYPSDNHHGWKFIAFGPDGKLYVPVGAPCNICKSNNPIYASITRINDDGSGFEIFANGVRNSVGFSWHPDTKALWFTENGSDMMGNDTPSDELNIAASAGLHFGYPYCHQGDVEDPEYGADKNCSDYVSPVHKLGAHVAALGMRFHSGNMFGEAYRNQIFIAEHGSWNRTEPVGYKVTLLKADSSGKVFSKSTFAEGWLQANGKVLGRPVDVAEMADGSLLISDDYAGVIYRVWKKI